MKQLALLFAAAVLCFKTSYALDPDMIIKPSGFAYYQFGQIEKTFDDGSSSGTPDKAWDQRFDIRLGVDAILHKNLELIGGAELGLLTNTNSTSVTLSSAFSPKEAQGIYTFGDNPGSKTPPLQVAVGYFPFKYDACATNMGEYLFSYRTGTYPPYIINDFDNDKARLLGVRVSGWAIDQIRGDVLLTSDQTAKPYGDYSLSFLAGFKNAYLDCGGGVSFNRLFPIDPSMTTPSADAPYTLKGIKVMARAAFDLKPLLSPEVNALFGPQDLKVYSEAAILGVKNYGTFYDTLMQRVPILLGFYFPTFGPECTSLLGFSPLDFISLEGEYFGYPYRNDLPDANDPTPTGGTDQFSNQNKIHWSIFTQKTVTKGFAIKALVGKDHFRYLDAGGNPTGGEMMRANGDWHYNVRLMFSF
jgi:hypothetical protein